MISIIHDEETEEQRDKLEGSDTTVQVDICPESCRDMDLCLEPGQNLSPWATASLPIYLPLPASLW